MFNLIVEGGAAGHMAHPFDLPDVNTGSDLLDFFETAKKFIDNKNPSAVKIDGVNVSFKVVGDEDKQFAVDRGSMKEIDISGITMDFAWIKDFQKVTECVQQSKLFLQS